MNEEFNEKILKKLIFKPISGIYLFLMILLGPIMIPLIFLGFRSALISGLGLSPFTASMILIISVFGSFINFPIKKILTNKPVLVLKEIRFFGVTWSIPELEISSKETIIAMNLGGAIVPIALSFYLLFFMIPLYEINPWLTYFKILISTILIAYFMKSFSRLIPGLGIAIPGILPPMITTFITMLIYKAFTLSNPFFIAYISGTLGTLIGADLLNLGKVSSIGAPIVSIGGAGTFDGIYLTGLFSMLFLLLI
ncbi:MAG: DUF1614 domain-containing protein [Candidatus Bathyarchaeia archaeon]